VPHSVDDTVSGGGKSGQSEDSCAKGDISERRHSLEQLYLIPGELGFPEALYSVLLKCHNDKPCEELCEDESHDHHVEDEIHG